MGISGRISEPISDLISDTPFVAIPDAVPQALSEHQPEGTWRGRGRSLCARVTAITSVTPHDGMCASASRSPHRPKFMRVFGVSQDGAHAATCLRVRMPISGAPLRMSCFTTRQPISIRGPVARRGSIWRTPLAPRQRCVRDHTSAHGTGQIYGAPRCITPCGRFGSRCDTPRRTRYEPPPDDPSVRIPRYEPGGMRVAACGHRRVEICAPQYCSRLGCPYAVAPVFLCGAR